MGVNPGEEVLVICNPVTEEIGALMRIEAQGDGADATLAVMSERDSAAAEPPRAVAAAMREADVVLAPTIQSVSHTAARKAASEAGVRVGSLPGVTEEMLVRLMNSDPRRCAGAAGRSSRR
jgi:leucyl aminopeptidase (aminopeptidase T)